MSQHYQSILLQAVPPEVRRQAWSSSRRNLPKKCTRIMNLELLHYICLSLLLCCGAVLYGSPRSTFSPIHMPSETYYEFSVALGWNAHPSSSQFASSGLRPRLADLIFVDLGPQLVYLGFADLEFPSIILSLTLTHYISWYEFRRQQGHEDRLENPSEIKFFGQNLTGVTSVYASLKHIFYFHWMRGNKWESTATRTLHNCGLNTTLLSICFGISTVFVWTYPSKVRTALKFRAHSF